MKNIILCGGGTGGHIYPALALLPKLKNCFDKIYFVGGNGMEKQIVPQFNIPFFQTETVKFERQNLMKNFAIPKALSSATTEAKILLENLKPDVIFSKGGYCSLPTVLAGKKLHIPIVCHESDMSLGLANKVARSLGATVCCASKKLALSHNFVFTGMPLRNSLFEISQSEAKIKLKISSNQKVLLILGGSTGAEFLNNRVYQSLDELTNCLFVIHISGKHGNFDVKHKNYLQLPYSNEIEVLLNASDYVLSRAGATAIAEISALHKKAIFVPLPKGISRGDQVANGIYAEELGAKVVSQIDFSKEVLLDSVFSLENCLPMRTESVNANEKITHILIEKAMQNEHSSSVKHK